MHYFVTIADRTYEVELGPDGIRVDGNPIDAEMISIPGTPIRRLDVSGRTHAVHAHNGEERGAWDLHIDGERFAATVIDQRTRDIRAMTGKSGAAQGPKPVKAPMPGLVTRILVETGSTVHAGQGVVLMEAMKMENELKADGAGVVGIIRVTAGQAVEKGAILIEFASEAS